MEKQNELHKIFVYGTLKHGFPNHQRFLKDCVGMPGTAPGIALHTDGMLPYACVGFGHLKGEIFAVDNATLSKIDRLEGHPNNYRRSPIEVQDEYGVFHEVWIYLHKDAKKFKPIMSGVWE